MQSTWDHIYTEIANYFRVHGPAPHTPDAQRQMVRDIEGLRHHILVLKDACPHERRIMHVYRKDGAIGHYCDYCGQTVKWGGEDVR